MTVARNIDLMPGARLRQLHRGVIDDESDVREILLRAGYQRAVLHNGVDRKSEPRTALIREVGTTELVVIAPNLFAAGQPQLYLHFDLSRTRYFFAAPPISGGGREPLRISIPTAIYEAERRDLSRKQMPHGSAAPAVEVRCSSGRVLKGRLRDWSYQGLAVAMESQDAELLTDRCEVSIEGGEFSGESRYAIVKRSEPDRVDGSWTRIGMESSQVSYAPPLAVERRDRILGGTAVRNAWRKVTLAGAMAKRLPASISARIRHEPTVEVTRYENTHGRQISALVDRAGTTKGGVAVVIPPAWGRTKETFLPLARTLTSTFEKLGVPGVVLRFDGTNRRGESYVAPENRQPGDEYLSFKFSEAVTDIRSSLAYVRREFKPEKVVLVSFSLGSVEARRAAALEGNGLDSWVSVVGMVDLQSGLRTVSGGLDFAYGQSLGVNFGRHELVGVLADMDTTGRDAFEHDLVFYEDAKRDMAALSLPISWIHGRYDAWMELDRVQGLLAAGDDRNRRLIEIPSGHQMRTSVEALQTFQLVSAEVVEHTMGIRAEAATPDLADLEARNSAERSRRPRVELDASRFWRDYLLGRDRRVGFELMSATTPYRSMMQLQINRLQLKRDHRVLDLGGGAGDFEVNLAECNGGPPIHVTQLDLVPDALRRSRDRLADVSPRFAVSLVASDLELTPSLRIPFASESFDSILASLLISYVEDPKALLKEIRRILKPGGRLVLSSMKRDADISRIYLNSLRELPPDRRAQLFGRSNAEDFDELQRVFMNDAAKLVQMEEEGRFQFYDESDLATLIEGTGFDQEQSDRAFGDPPQAVVVSAIRRR